MEKTIITSYGGVNANVGDLVVNRLLPNRYSQAVGPFVFLDHLYPSEHQPKMPQAPTGPLPIPTGALPRSPTCSAVRWSTTTATATTASWRRGERSG
jgi:hypothetical protein